MKSIIKINLFFYILATATLFVSCDDYDDDNVVPEIPAEQTQSINIVQNSEFGQVITDNAGNTLYFFTKDTDGNSACEGNCEEAWPVFYQRDLEAGNGLEASDIAVIERADGSKQNTYKGWPLYYFSGDQEAGEINGDGAGKTWYVAKPDYKVMIASKEIEAGIQNYLVDDRGNTLYFFTQDEGTTSNCEGNCLVNWPAFSTDNNELPSFFDADQFDVTAGNDGSNQVTFDDRPMYFFINDVQRGDVNGQNVGDVWFVNNINFD